MISLRARRPLREKFFPPRVSFVVESGLNAGPESKSPCQEAPFTIDFHHGLSVHR
jgi:hypothetical protein